ETDLQLGNAPVGLDGRARVTLNGQPSVLAGQIGRVIDHVSSEFYTIRTGTAEKGSRKRRQEALFTFRARRKQDRPISDVRAELQSGTITRGSRGARGFCPRHADAAAGAAGDAE